MDEIGGSKNKYNNHSVPIMALKTESIAIEENTKSE